MSCAISRFMDLLASMPPPLIENIMPSDQRSIEVVKSLDGGNCFMSTSNMAETEGTKAYLDRLDEILDSSGGAHLLTAGTSDSALRPKCDLVDQRNIVESMAHLAGYRDNDTGGHLDRIRAGTLMVSRILLKADIFPEELSPLSVEKIGLASTLHDIGKVGIPDCILRKPGAFTADERKIMERHAVLGSKYLMETVQRLPGYDSLCIAAEIALHHHEQYDGNGYPHGLAGNTIPLSARIVAVIDVYDALTSARPYKGAWPDEVAMSYIHTHAGTHFDPRIVEAFELWRLAA